MISFPTKWQLVPICIFTVAAGLLACRQHPAQGTDAEVRERLESYENGKLTLDQVTSTEPGVASAAWVDRLISYYSVHSNSMSAKMRLPISRCYAILERYTESLQLAREYVTVHSNDWHAWRIIGSVHYSVGNFREATVAYANAVRLGDDCSCVGLAVTAMKTDDDQVVKDLLPRLHALREMGATNCIDPLEISAVMIVYSLRSGESEVFESAIQGLSVKDIMSRPDLPVLAKKGCNLFKTKESEELLKGIEAASDLSHSKKVPRPEESGRK